MAERIRYWFPAKRYGWGWGLPVSWQGWLVLVVFGLFVVLGVFIVPPTRDALSFVIYNTIGIAALLAVCWAKGEPPAWRWGRK